MRSSCSVVFRLAAAFCLIASVSAPAFGDEPAAGPPRVTLATIDFHSTAGGDERDQWIPFATEATLNRRLRHLPGVLVVPLARPNQLRRELGTAPDQPADWGRVCRALGVRLVLSGEVSGPPHAVALSLTLRPVDGAAGGVERDRTEKFGPGPLGSVLDAATDWSVKQLSPAPLRDDVAAIVAEPLSDSQVALESFARAVQAGRESRLREAADYLADAINYDPRCRPALLLLAQMHAAGPPELASKAATELRAAGVAARQSHDRFDEVEIELALGRLLLRSGMLLPAAQRFAHALATADTCGHEYGAVAALEALSEICLLEALPEGPGASEDRSERFTRQQVARSAAWLEEAHATLKRLGDLLGQASSANKLAALHERLGDDQQARNCLDRMLVAAQAAGAPDAELQALMYIGQFHRRKHEWDDAISAMRRSLELAGKDLKPAVRMALADVYVELKRPDEAIAEYEQALTTLEAANTQLTDQFACLRALAELEHALGRRREAINRLKAAIDVAYALELKELPELRGQLADWQQGVP